MSDAGVERARGPMESDVLSDRAEDYRAIFEATGDGVIIADMDGNLVEVNPALCRMHGYTRGEMLRLHPTDFIHPSYHGVFAEYMASLNEGRPYRTSALDLRKDGTAFPVEVNGTVFLYHGRRHVLGVVRDVSDRARAEEQLRERESQYRGIFESTLDAIVISDFDGRVVEVNPAFCRSSGFSRGELLGSAAIDLVPPFAREQYASFLQTIREGGVYRGRGVGLTKDGRVIQTDAVGATVMYKGKPHVLLVARDITEQQLAEEQLREREEQYRRIFESTSDGLIINDPATGCVVEANPAVCRMHGYSYEEFIGLHATAFIHPDYHPVFAEFRETIAAGGDYQCEAIDTRKDGSSFHVEVHGSSVMYGGRPQILAVVRDITERVQARELLGQRVEERTRELATLLDVAHNLGSTLQLQPLLGLILDQLKVVAPYSGAAIFQREGDELVVLVRRAPGPNPDAGPTRYTLATAGMLWTQLKQGKPVVINDLRGTSPLARAYQSSVGPHLETTFAFERSWLGVPMTLRDQVIGIVTLSSNEVEYFTDHHLGLAQGIAQQAAIAIENARLYERAQEIAVLEERQRLSRELHDSVSQALYSIALGARTARTLLDRDPATVAEPLEFVLAQAERGLAEMRALIFELRPESLEQEGLAGALRKQVESLRTRYDLQVALTADEEPDAPLHVKEALYRIAQEAMQNVVKHAAATELRLIICCVDSEILLEIADNGKGFNTDERFPGHLGLSSMRERAERLGGVLDVESAPGAGTTIRARIPSSGPPAAPSPSSE